MPSDYLIEAFTCRYSESKDQAWESMRSLHEQGYVMSANGEFEVMFIREATGIYPMPMSGRIVWVHSMSMPVTRSSLNFHLLGGGLHFPDPVAVAAWWEVEVSNMPSSPSTPAVAPGMAYPQAPAQPQLPQIPSAWAGIQGSPPAPFGWQRPAGVSDQIWQQAMRSGQFFSQKEVDDWGKSVASLLAVQQVGQPR